MGFAWRELGGGHLAYEYAGLRFADVHPRGAYTAAIYPQGCGQAGGLYRRGIETEDEAKAFIEATVSVYVAEVGIEPVVAELRERIATGKPWSDPRR